MLQVIAKLEGPAISQYCALRLLQVDTSIKCEFLTFFPAQLVLILLNPLQATLDESLYELAGELVGV